MPKMPLIRDLIYFDFDKAASIFSQVEGGLLQDMKTGVESTTGKKRAHKLELPLYKPEASTDQSEKTSEIESRVMHHDLIARIENTLFDEGIALDINEALAGGPRSAETIREHLTAAMYLRTEGWSALEDHDRLKGMAAEYNDLISFITKCSVVNTEAYKAATIQLKTLEKSTPGGSSRSQGNAREVQIKALRKQLNDQVVDATRNSGVEKWLIDGIMKFMDTLMPSRVVLRVYPFEDVPEFQVVANLKRKCLIDEDLENLVFAYGTKPNVKLTLLGLVTSIPQHDGVSFDPLQEFANIAGAIPPERAIEHGLRNVFTAFDNIEGYLRSSYYPSVTVYPIAVYRTVRPASLSSID